MTTRKAPPFYANFDDTHCVQCVLRGIMEHFEPEKTWTWEELDRFSGKKPNKWTWGERATINLIKRGYTVKEISANDRIVMLKEGIYNYFERTLGKEAAIKQQEMADFNEVEADVTELLSLKEFSHETRLPNIEDIRKFIDQGYLIWASLNVRTLNNKNGYASHCVLIYDIDESHVYMQDSGLPIEIERKVSIEDYVAASTSPTESQWEVTAVKLEK